MIIVLTPQQRDIARSLGIPDDKYAYELRKRRALYKAADALRRHEQDVEKLNDWDAISALQRGRWIKKAALVLEAYKVAFVTDIK